MSSNLYDAPPPGSYTPAGENPNPVLGIISLVTGILSFVPGCCCGLIGAPLSLVAVVTGAIGIVMANQGKMGGKGMAIAGLICGAIYLAFFILGLILNLAGLADPNFLEQRLRELQNQ